MTTVDTYVRARINSRTKGQQRHSLQWDYVLLIMQPHRCGSPMSSGTF